MPHSSNLLSENVALRLEGGRRMWYRDGSSGACYEWVEVILLELLSDELALVDLSAHQRPWLTATASVRRDRLFEARPDAQA